MIKCMSLRNTSNACVVRYEVPVLAAVCLILPEQVNMYIAIFHFLNIDELLLLRSHRRRTVVISQQKSFNEGEGFDVVSHVGKDPQGLWVVLREFDLNCQ